MTGSFAQLRALALLRWQMIRSTSGRLMLFVAAVFVLWLLEAVATSAHLLQPAALSAAIALAPAAFLGFVALVVIAPLTAGGGSEIVPSSQLVAYPVRASTQFLGGLLLAPVNLVWVAQILALAAETAYLTVDANGPAGAVTTTAFIVCMTILGQAVAWTVVGLRQTRGGRAAVVAAGLVTVASVVVVVRLRLATAALRLSPTHVVVSAVQSAPGRTWAITTAVLVIASAAGLRLGIRACTWALRRPGDAGVTTAGTRHRRRSAQPTVLRELVAVDRASVWRAPALRRGGLVLALLPGLAAIGTAIPWASLIVLPGLVAAGAGLLFGVNAFSLDGAGAVWLASLPHDPRHIARAKLVVLTETIAGAVVVALAVGCLRSPGRPTTAQLTAIASSSVACAALVIATCMALSVRRPHRADLRGPRDAVAPPGALAAASARLAFPAAFLGFILDGASQGDTWWAPPVVALPFLLGSLLWLRRSLSSYADPGIRARVTHVVAAG